MRLLQRGWLRFALLCLGSAWLLSPWLSQFAFSIGSDFTDAAITHVPNAIYLRNALFEWRQIPLWSNTIFSGYPFAANPLSGLWYLPTWLAAMLPQPFGLNFMVLVHQLAGTWGFYRLMRAEGVEKWPAVAGALVFLLLPRTLAHYAAGHVTLVFAFAWTPWLLLAARRENEGGSRRFPVLEGILLAGIILADVRWLAYAGMLWVAYRLHLHYQMRTTAGKKWGRFIFASGLQVLMAGILSAPLLLPLMEYSALSTRILMQAKDNLYLSLPTARLFGLLFPSVDGNVEWTVYSGGLPVLLLVWTVFTRELRKKAGFWLSAAILGLLLALGGALPGYDLLARLPGFDLLRVPARFLLVTGMAIAAMSAHAAQFFFRHNLLEGRGAYAARLVTVAAAGFSLVGALGIVIIGENASMGFIWGTGALLCASALVFLRERNYFPGAAWLWMIAALILVDLAGVSVMTMRFRPANDVFAEGGAAAKYLSDQPGRFRIYSPSYSIPQQTAAQYDLEQVNGIDPLQLRGYASIMEDATGVAAQGYNVTIPRLDGISPFTSNVNALPDAAMLGLFNVHFVATEYDLFAEGLAFEAQFGNTRIYRNQYARPRAWLQLERKIADENSGFSSVEIARWTANEIVLNASGPGVLVLSEVDYPGWQVRVDGRNEPILGVGEIFRGVNLADGNHEIRFVFRPPRVYAGLGFAVGGWLAMAMMISLSRRKSGDDPSR